MSWQDGAGSDQSTRSAHFETRRLVHARPKTPSKRVFMRLWEDGEYANAREYLELYDVTLWPQELARLAGGYSRIEGVRA